MSKLASRLPEEFVNSPDLQGLDFRDLFQDLEEIRKKLMAGDLAGALEAAQRLLQALTEMMAAMGRAGAQANMGGMDRMQGEMNRQSSELGKILEEQKEILQETEKIEREVRRRIEEEIRRRLAEELPGMRQRLEEMGRSLPAEEKELVEELARLLKDEKIKEFSQRAKELEKELGREPENQKRLRELREMAEKLFPDPGKNLSAEEKERFPGPLFPPGNAKEEDAGIAGKSWRCCPSSFRAWTRKS